MKKKGICFNNFYCGDFAIRSHCKAFLDKMAALFMESDRSVSCVNLGVSYLTPEKQFGLMGPDNQLVLPDGMQFHQCDPDEKMKPIKQGPSGLDFEKQAVLSSRNLSIGAGFQGMKQPQNMR